MVAKVEFHFGELFPRVGFIVTNLETDSRAAVRCRSCRSCRSPATFSLACFFGATLACLAAFFAPLLALGAPFFWLMGMLLGRSAECCGFPPTMRPAMSQSSQGRPQPPVIGAGISVSFSSMTKLER